MGWIVPLKKKSDAYQAIINFITFIERQFNVMVLIVVTDNGGEYVQIDAYFKQKGIRHVRIPPYSHESNGVPERFNRTIQTMARSMLAHVADKRLWAEACSTAVYLKNLLPHAHLQKKTPFEALYKRKPTITHLRPFGSLCYIHIYEDERLAGSKLYPRAELATFVGYTDSISIYRVQLPSKHIKTMRAALCTFLPTSIPIGTSQPASLPIGTSQPASLPIGTLLNNLRTGQTRYDLRPRAHISIDLIDELALMAVDSQEPSNYKQAIACSDAPKWSDAMKDELKILMDQGVWEVVPTPANHNIVGSRWVFKIKRDAAGNISRYKARLVAQGFSQQPGTDFDEIFAPVVRYDSLRLLIALSISLGWPIPDQLDIKGAFLYGYLEEEVYMKLPPGHEQAGMCARLKRSIYGLKQSPRQWYGRLTGFLIPIGYIPCNFDPCVLIHITHQIFIAIYVDDLTIFGASPVRHTLKEALKKEFELTDLGCLNWLLGIRIEWLQNSVTLSQQAYIDQLLSKYGMDTCNPVSLPLNTNQKLVKAEDGIDLADVSLYQQIIGSLMYLVIGTRADLAFTVSALSQFASKPTVTHMGALKQVLRYVKGTRDLKLTYNKHHFGAPHFAGHSDAPHLAGYSDADYAGDRSDRKSTSGYIFQFAGNTICWRAIKQKCTATSTVEAEYIALSTAAK
jgi:hypothetical protein